MYIMFLKGSYAYQGCIYLIKNIAKTINIITV